MISRNILTYFWFYVILQQFFAYCSDHPGLQFEYEGPTWQHIPKHQEAFRDGKKDILWGKMRIHIELVKNPTEPSYRPALSYTHAEWMELEKIIDDLFYEMHKVVLKVRQLASPIVIPRRCYDKNTKQRLRTTTNCSYHERGEICELHAVCYDLDVPNKFAGPCFINNMSMFPGGVGSRSDLLIFVSIQDCDELANAVRCQTEPTFDRPVAGRIAVCYKTLRNRQNTGSRLTNVLMHELLHIIAWPLAGVYFKNKSGLPYDKETYVIEHRKWLSADGEFDRSFVLNTLPTVVQVVREHFNCLTLTGAELYNNSGSYHTSFSSYSHFDSRLFPDSLMSPYFYTGQKLTNLEVAILIDTGWYIVDKLAGRNLTITRGKGCDFATKSCYEFMKLNNYDPAAIYPYCRESDKNRWMCSLDAKQVSFCHGKKEKYDVSSWARLADGLFYGPEHMSYCPMVISPAFTADKDSSPLCREDSDVDLEGLGASGGSENSICMRFFDFHARQTKYQCPKQKALAQGVCVTIKCHDDGTFTFKFGGREHSCSNKTLGQIVGEQKITTFPFQCKVAFKFCCPNFDVCSYKQGKYFNSSVIKAPVSCRASLKYFLLTSLFSCILLNFIFTY